MFYVLALAQSWPLPTYQGEADLFWRENPDPIIPRFQSVCVCSASVSVVRSSGLCLAIPWRRKLINTEILASNMVDANDQYIRDIRRQYLDFLDDDVSILSFFANQMTL